MTERFELSRRKVLAGIGTIGAASAGVGVGTSAYFSDVETYTNNRLTAGQLDLTVGWQESYSDWSDDETTGFSGVPKMSDPETGDYVGFPVGAPTDEKLVYVERADTAPFIRNTAIDAYPDPNDNGTLGPTESNDPCEILADTPEDLDPTAGDRTLGEDTYDSDAPEGERVRPLVSIDDVKPGDFGQIVFPFALCDNPGYVWMTGRLVSAAENGLTEPEVKDPDEQEGVVELLDEVRIALYYADDLGDYAEDRVETFFVGSLRDALDLLSSGQGIPLDGNRSTPFDEIDGTDDAPSRECFLGVNSQEAPPFHFVGVSWYLPVDHANEIQTDSVSFDLGFYTEQCRHNDGDGMTPEAIERIETSEGFGTNSGDVYSLTQDAGYPENTVTTVRRGSSITFELDLPKPLDDAQGDNWSLTVDADDDGTADFQVAYNDGFSYQEFDGSWGSAPMPGGIDTSVTDNGGTYVVEIPLGLLSGTFRFGGQLRYNGEEPGNPGQNFVVDLVPGFAWGPGFNGDSDDYYTVTT